jgi:hypothetical protein
LQTVLCPVIQTPGSTGGVGIVTPFAEPLTNTLPAPFVNPCQPPLTTPFVNPLCQPQNNQPGDEEIDAVANYVFDQASGNKW